MRDEGGRGCQQFHKIADVICERLQIDFLFLHFFGYSLASRTKIAHKTHETKNVVIEITRFRTKKEREVKVKKCRHLWTAPYRINKF